MKKIILLLSVVLMFVGFLGLVGCSDDDDDNNSSVTGLDFSDDDYFDNLDVYMFVDGTDSEFRIMLASDKLVTSSELIINSNTLSIGDAWVDISSYDEFLNYIVWIDDSMLPDGLVFEPGIELDIKLMVNGSNYNNVLSIPNAPTLEDKTLDLNQDFTVTWTLDQNPMMQVVSLDGGVFLWGEEEDFDEEVQVNGAVRSHKFSKRIYSDFNDITQISYGYSVETINYAQTGKYILMLTSADYIDKDGFMSKQDKSMKIKNLIKSIQK